MAWRFLLTVRRSCQDRREWHARRDGPFASSVAITWPTREPKKALPVARAGCVIVLKPPRLRRPFPHNCDTGQRPGSALRPWSPAYEGGRRSLEQRGRRRSILHRATALLLRRWDGRPTASQKAGAAEKVRGQRTIHLPLHKRPVPILAKRRLQFTLRVHDDGSLPGDRFAKRFA